MEVRTIRSFQGCECTRLLSLASHHIGWVDVAGAWDRPLFVASGMSYCSGGEKADVLSPPFINIGIGFEPSLQLSPMA
jgi:hypothetical protein